MVNEIIKTVAPFLGTLIGGPIGGVATKIVSKILTGNEDATQDEIEKSLANASPEVLLKLKEADISYKKKLADIGINEKKIAALDRHSARERQSKTGDIMPSILAVCLTLGFFGVLSSLMFFEVPESSRSIIDVMLGALGTAWISVITYYFGSSASSKIKTGLILKKGDNYE